MHGHLHTHTATYIHTQPCTYMHGHIHTHTATDVHARPRTYTHSHAHACTATYTYARPCTYTHGHVHTCTAMDIHTRPQTYTHSHMRRSGTTGCSAVAMLTEEGEEGSGCGNHTVRCCCAAWFAVGLMARCASAWSCCWACSFTGADGCRRLVVGFSLLGACSSGSGGGSGSGGSSSCQLLDAHCPVSCSTGAAEGAGWCEPPASRMQHPRRVQQAAHTVRPRGAHVPGLGPLSTIRSPSKVG